LGAHRRDEISERRIEYRRVANGFNEPRQYARRDGARRRGCGTG
jgi:hypothetical protein